MSERSPKRSFAARPADPEDWIKAPERHASRSQPAEDFSARLTEVAGDDAAGFFAALTMDQVRALAEESDLPLEPFWD